MPGICSGLTVLELGGGSIGAAMAGRVFADFGARVVKVEPPSGDPLRTLRPSGHRVWNRGKESLVADLRDEAGRALAREWAARADVVLWAFAPGRSVEWGLTYDELAATNPGLVYADITAFGETGPYAAIKGYDSLVCAKSGLWDRGPYGHRDGPIAYPVPWGSFGAAMQLVAGTAGALLVRDRTGVGQRVSATMFAGLEPLEYFMQTVLQLARRRGDTSSAVDPRQALGASRYGVLVCTRDGIFIQTSTNLPHQGWALSEVAEITDKLTDERFARLPSFATAEDAQVWEDMLCEAFRSRDLAYWEPRLRASLDVAYEFGITSEEGLDHPQVVHNGDAITIDDPEVGPVRQLGPIGHYSETPCVIETSAPKLGEHGELFGARPVRPASGVPAVGGPFSGVTIVEFGYFYAMPFGLAQLASLGARVIKIEDGKGDPHRTSFGPEVGTNKTTVGKESVSLDLSTPEGQAAAQRIVDAADVFVTGFRTGIPERFGLGFAESAARNPKLVYVHAAGYGTDGPFAKRPLYAQAAQAVAGSFGRQVGFWSAPERNEGMTAAEIQAVIQPRLNQVTDGDSNAAVVLSAALALAILHQQRTGRGQFLRTSMIAGNAMAYSDDFCTYAGKTPVPVCDDEYFGTSALERIYETADEGYLSIAIGSERQWRGLVAALGLPELLADSRFAQPSERSAHDEALVEILQVRFRTAAADHWEKTLVDSGVGCVIPTVGGHPLFIVTDPVVRETGLTFEGPDPLLGQAVRLAPQVRLSRTPGRVGLPCARGQHNRSVLAELGYSEAELDALEATGALVPPA